MRKALQARHGDIVAISADKIEALKAGQARNPGLPCLVASDPGATAAEALQLLQLNMAKVGKRMAIPANILIDEHGVVRWTRYAQIVMDRPGSWDVLNAVLTVTGGEILR